MTNGVASSALSLNTLETWSTEFAELSDLYRYFRINRLKVTGIWHGGATGSEGFGLYFQPNGTGGAPSQFALLEGKYAIGMSYAVGTAGVFAHLELGRDELHTITPWFVTLNDTSAGADADGPGIVSFVTESGTTTDGILITDVEMSITFRSRLDPSTISANLTARVEARLSASKMEKLDSKPEMQQAPRTKVLVGVKPRL